MTIIIVDDHDLFREGLAMLFVQANPGEDVWHQRTMERAEAQLARMEKEAVPDGSVLLADIGSICEADARARQRVRDLQPMLKLAILYGSMEGERLRQALGWMPDAMIPKRLVTAGMTSQVIDLVRSGGSYAPLPLVSGLLEEAGRPENPARPGFIPFAELTPRQNQILEMLGRGLTNAQIAAEAGISEGTVRIHVSAVLNALKVSTRTHAALMAQERMYTSGAVA